MWLNFYPQGESCECVLKPPHPHLTPSYKSLTVVTWDNCARTTDPNNFSPQKIQEMGNAYLSDVGHPKSTQAIHTTQ